ncbi:uncharacterized protein LOC109707379 [Ananas comosus]|uniref:Uncharacterized protein LOC109707379 n=1 Tax=Ananas comosus TaxID=4615 RepID=A0A6P5EL80_ANACO|nr:uncharacterized protein LOC109707379 [Ananas comosus]
MDPSAPPKGGGGGGDRVGEEEVKSERNRASGVLIRCCLSIAFSIVASFVFSFLLGLAALAIGNLSASTAVSVSSTCRIVSSSIDLRSSKVCELGLLNYNAKHVFYPSEKRKFRCRDDYYWASVFQVEYKEYFSGQLFHAVAEAPKEALPHDCRPDFGTAWLMRLKFKVNETYNCRYMPGGRKADIYSDDLFNCQTKEPSLAEMTRRIFILSTRSYTIESLSSRLVGYIVGGIVSGMLSAMCVIVLLKSLQGLFHAATNRLGAKKSYIIISLQRFRRACLILAYFSAVGWLTLQYGKKIGLKQLLLDTKLRERII